MEQVHSPYQVTNPLTGDGVLVSPQRLARPWQGKTELVQEADMPEYDPACYLCPGNVRSTGNLNPQYEGTYSFPNDFPTLLPERAESPVDDAPLFQTRPEAGICEVLCYSPRHDRTLVNMDKPETIGVVNLWQERYRELIRHPLINHVQIFESRGPEVGASNAHPHAQIWAEEYIPNLPAKELHRQEMYYRKLGSVMLLDYARDEIARDTRIVYQNDHFLTVVPNWAVWPYEMMQLPLDHIPSLDVLTDDQKAGLADSVSVVVRAYGKFFQRPKYGAPYLMGIHQLPAGEAYTQSAQMHVHFQSPLLTPTRQKMMGGYEHFAQPQRDLPAERAAGELREVVQDILKEGRSGGKITHRDD